jgi:hypothetical protein
MFLKTILSLIFILTIFLFILLSINILRVHTILPNILLFSFLFFTISLSFITGTSWNTYNLLFAFNSHRFIVSVLLLLLLDLLL